MSGFTKVEPGIFLVIYSHLKKLNMSGNMFNSVLMKRPKSNVFNLSYDIKLSCKFGQLVPIHVQECIPGDIFRGRSQVLMRFAPMLAPVMHQIDLYCHFFFVPNRILWQQWEDFITASDETVTPPFLYLTDALAANGTLADYLGLPSSDIAVVDYDAAYSGREDRQFNAFPFAAYQRIWLEYYRDRNLEFPDKDARDQMLAAGVNVVESDSVKDWHQIRQRAWQKDYFASALPYAQKGPTMMVPFGFDEDVPVYTKDDGATGLQTTEVNLATANTPASTNPTKITAGNWQTTGGTDMAIDAEASGFRARTTALTLGSGSIEDLRTAFRLQEWLERNARGGTRYVESILAHFGIRVKDYRLDRPEMIGGGKARIQISEVLQTAEPTDPLTQTPLATMGGHGISAGYVGSYNYRCPEHGFIIGIMSVRPRPAYYMGVPRHFMNRKDRLDYYWPSFAHLGEQAIQNSELVYTGADPNADLTTGTFGYTPRYAEYRKNYSRVAGDFNTSLDFWHLGRKFPTVPTLDYTFTQVDSEDIVNDMDRIFAVQDGTDYLWAQVVHDIRALRPMPRFAIPSI